MKTVVRDVMTSQVVWVKKDAPYKEIAARLRENRVSAFPAGCAVKSRRRHVE
jgi:CBS domain-containing protein